MNKIIVVGTTGSGKSRLAVQLAEKLIIPYIQMDLLFWEPNWTQPRDEVFLSKVERAIQPSRWVLDGNYGKTHHLTWSQADTVIWIDFPLLITVYQNFLRGLKRSLNREELWPGTNNRESLGRLYSKDSILLWLLKTYKPNRLRFQDKMKDPKYAHIKFIHLRSRKEVKTFLDQITPPNSP